MKLLVFAIDGADFSNINKFIDELPTFKKLMRESHSGLKSSIPPVSMPAWFSIYTGKNPGKLGVFDFTEFKNNYDSDIRDDKIHEKKIWEYLSDKDKKCLILNLFLTYYPEKINGTMVCGCEIQDGVFYPEKLKKEVEEKLGKLQYEEYTHYYNTPEEEVIKRRLRSINNKYKLAKYLLEKEKFDFAMLGFNTDDCNHLIKTDSGIKRVYHEIDRKIGEIIKISKADNVVVFSDHGGGLSKYEFNVNEFLRKEGYLVLKKQKQKKSSFEFLVKLGLGMENILKILQKTKIDRILVKLLPGRFFESIKKKIPRKEVLFKDANIDWSKTKAFSPYNGGGAIRVNLKGREEKGVVSEKEYDKIAEGIIEDLKNLKGPDGRKLNAEVYKKEEIYSGKYLKDSPDIIYSIEEWKYPPKITFRGRVFSESRDGKNHRQYGIFIACGKDIKSGEIKSASIYDIAPSILHFFNLPIPEDMDGKVLDIFRKQSKVRYRKAERRIEEKKGGMKKEDKEKMRKRLKVLGYIE